MLRDCLASLHPDTQHAHLEVIVVDNASVDGAAEMVRQEFPWVRLVCNASNRGFSFANNQAAQLACGEFLFFLNNDTLVPPHTLQSLLDFADKHPQAVMFGPKLKGTDGKIQVSYRSKPTVGTLLHRTTLLRWTSLFREEYRLYRRTDFQDSDVREVAVLMGAAILVRKSDFDRWGGWDEEFAFGGEDLELSIRAGQYGKLIYWPDVEVVHHGRASTRQHPSFAPPQIAVGMVKFLRKTGTPAWQIMLYKTAITLDAPLTMMVKLVEYCWRTVRRRPKAKKSLLSALAAASLLRWGLLDFWRA